MKSSTAGLIFDIELARKGSWLLAKDSFAERTASEEVGLGFESVKGKKSINRSGPEGPPGLECAFWASFRQAAPTSNFDSECYLSFKVVFANQKFVASYGPII